MVDSGDLKSPGRNAVWVRLPPSVPKNRLILGSLSYTICVWLSAISLSESLTNNRTSPPV